LIENTAINVELFVLITVFRKRRFYLCLDFAVLLFFATSYPFCCSCVAWLRLWHGQRACNKNYSYYCYILFYFENDLF